MDNVGDISGKKYHTRNLSHLKSVICLSSIPKNSWRWTAGVKVRFCVLITEFIWDFSFKLWLPYPQWMSSDYCMDILVEPRSINVKTKTQIDIYRYISQCLPITFVVDGVRYSEECFDLNWSSELSSFIQLLSHLISPSSLQIFPRIAHNLKCRRVCFVYRKSVRW